MTELEAPNVDALLLTALAVSDEPLGRGRLLDIAVPPIVGKKSAWRGFAKKRIDALVEDGQIQRAWGDQRYCVSALVAPWIIERSNQSGHLDTVVSNLQALRVWSDHYYGYSGHIDPGHLRVALARRDGASIDEWLTRAQGYRPNKKELRIALVAALTTVPPDPWLEQLDLQMQGEFLTQAVADGVCLLRPLSAQVIEAAVQLNQPQHQLMLARWHCLRGDFEQAQKAGPLPKAGDEVVAFLIAFWSGDFSGAYDLAERAVHKSGRRKYNQLKHTEGLCHALTRVLTSTEHTAAWDELFDSVLHAGKAGAGFAEAYDELGDLHRLAKTGHAAVSVRWETDDWWHAAIKGLIAVWYPQRDGALLQVDRWRDAARKGGYRAVERQLAAVIEALGEGGDDTADDPALWVYAYRPQETWEVALESLARLGDPATGADPQATGFQPYLRWELAHDGDSYFSLVPRLITSERTKVGKAISMARLVDDTENLTTAADRRVLSHVARSTSYYGRGATYDFETGALLALVGHPQVVSPQGRPIEVVQGHPKLTLESTKSGARLKLEPESLNTRSFASEVSADGATLCIYQRTPEVERTLEAMGGPSLRVPLAGKKRLLKALANNRLPVPVDLGDTQVQDSTQVPAMTTLVAALDWHRQELSISLRCAPLGLQGPLVLPGEGRATVFADLAGKLVQAERNLAGEQQSLQLVRQRCPTLDLLGSDSRIGKQHHWLVTDLADALTVLLEFKEAGDAVEMTWPEGRKLSAPTQRSIDHLQVTVKEATQWLNVEVELPVDEGRVMKLKELLASRDASGRFVKLGDDQFVALTDALQKRLEAFESIGAVGDKGLQAPPVLLPLIEELTAEAGGLNYNARAKKHRERLQKIATEVPKVPRTLKANLRDYQLDGFVWLARLGRAGLGACLADDMGLGKTIMALGVLCERAKEGPALVVAPTSVVSNWRAEAERFAPTLRFLSLNDSPDRRALVDGAKKRDVVLCSYGLLVSEAQTLTQQTFSTVIFDEGHALKNPKTKRARAAFGLRAGFRLALTGSPIENHLGELWSLMQATVPGLLGTQKRFETRFMSPISNGDRRAASQLRAMVKPFMLRRTKSQVLDELPERSEILLKIEPTANERAFYELIRRQALERAADQTSKSGNARLQLLAEIMKLRQVAVDPRLLKEGANIVGAKIPTLVRRLADLKEEGHRALVFSQFLTALDHIQLALDAAGLTSLRLDGSTPAAVRTRRIEAFQNGEGDVFAISLKAGGVGINLTGADYVFHVDPWWNPAVEDQATSRAHRLGQKRPVTVYRLITAGTIEEKINDLHKKKRDLAGDLLAGLNQAGKLDFEQLRMLLTDDRGAGATGTVLPN